MTQQLKKNFVCPGDLMDFAHDCEKCGAKKVTIFTITSLEALLNEMFAAKIAEYNYPKAPHCVEVLEGLQIDILNQIKGEG